MKVYYNEFDAKKGAALKALMDDGFITAGDIDTRPIQDVRSDDLKHYDRCHFFAGIGLWDYALNLARWPEGLRVWTGSCPCQPFSTAGRQKGKRDDRHLWPSWFGLIQECRPPVIFGEQVANAISKGWLDDVYQGLEAEDYAVGSAVLPACSVGAPHKRDRLWFVAHTAHSDDRRNAGEFQGADECEKAQRQERRSAELSGAGIMGDTQHNGQHAAAIDGSHEKIDDRGAEKQNRTLKPSGTSSARPLPSEAMADSALKRSADNNAEYGETKQEQYRGRSRGISLANAGGERSQRPRELSRPLCSKKNTEREANRVVYDSSRHWEDGQWIICPDEKQRLIEPSICLLADGHPERVGLLHSAGDAIVPQVAAGFIECSLDAIGL